MPFSAEAQPTKTDFRIFCALAVNNGSVIFDLPGIRNEKLGGSIGYAECLNAVATLIEENSGFVLLVTMTDWWMENEDVHRGINAQICLNRLLSRWPLGTCDEFLESIE